MSPQEPGEPLDEEEEQNAGMTDFRRKEAGD